MQINIGLPKLLYANVNVCELVSCKIWFYESLTLDFGLFGFTTNILSNKRWVPKKFMQYELEL